MKKRVYYALTFDDSTTHQIIENIEILKKEAAHLKPIPYNSIHMTLAFIGDVEETLIPELCDILNEVKCDPFQFIISSYGTFDDARNTKLYYLSTKDDHSLYQLQKRLTDALKAHHIPFHDRQFLPHITLARKTECHDHIPFKFPIIVQAKEFHLLESVPYKNTRIGVIIK